MLTGPSLQYLGMSSSSRQKQKHKSQRKNFGEGGGIRRKRVGGRGLKGQNLRARVEACNICREKFVSNLELLFQWTVGYFAT